MANCNENCAIRTMKIKFSSSWKGSSQVRKQRKYRINAPVHIKHSFLGAHLSKELRAKHKTRSLPLRKGDEVTVLRGSSHKKKAKVLNVDLKKSRVTLEGITRTKKDGSKIPVYFRAHALMITSLHGEDKKRMKHLNQVNKKEKDNAPNKSSN